MKRIIKSKQVFTLLFALMVPVALLASDINLRLNVDKGTDAKYNSTTEQVITQTINGMQQVINQNQIFEYTISILGKGTEGNLEAKVTFNRIAVDMKMQGMEMSFDSEDESSTSPANPQFLVFKAMVDKSVTATISPLGKIIEVKGVEEMRNQMISETGGGAQAEQTIGAAITEESIKQMFAGAFITYPEKTINANSTWTENQTIENQFVLNTINSYSVLSLNNNEAQLSLSATMSTVPGNKSNMQGMEVTYNLFGTTSGTISLNPKTGMITESSMEQNITGNIAGDMMGQKLDIPMAIVSKTTVKQL